MNVTLKPATIRKVEKLLTEWHALAVKVDDLAERGKKLPDGAKLHKVLREMQKVMGRQNTIHRIVTRTLFNREGK